MFDPTTAAERLRLAPRPVLIDALRAWNIGAGLHKCDKAMLLDWCRICIRNADPESLEAFMATVQQSWDDYAARKFRRQ